MPPAHRGGQIGDDVAEQVVGDDHVEAARIGDDVDGGRVDVLIGDLDVGILGGPPPRRSRHHSAPAYVSTLFLCTSVRCLRRCWRRRERVAHDAFDAERGVQADLGGDLVRCADADRTAGCRCTGPRCPRGRRRSRCPGFRPAGCRRPDTAGRGGDSRGGRARTGSAAAGRARARRWAPTDRRSRRAGSRRARAARRAPSRAGPRRWRGNAARRGRSLVFSTPGRTASSTLQRLADDLGSDAVAGNDRQFHARSTTSSRLAPTASAIAARTSRGTSRSMRIRIVALGPSASSLSCAA